MGRPSSYKPEYARQAKKLCALGAIDADLADFFGVSERTINSWKEKHSEFLQSLKEAKSETDSRVVRALFERAIGYSHPEDKIFNNNGKALIVKTTKHYPPDTAAAFIWLKNRQPDEWKERPEGGGNVGSEELLKRIADMLPD